MELNSGTQFRYHEVGLFEKLESGVIVEKGGFGVDTILNDSSVASIANVHDYRSSQGPSFKFWAPLRNIIERLS